MSRGADGPQPADDGGTMGTTLVPDHDTRWVLATAAIGIFALYFGYALHMLAWPTMHRLVIQQFASPTGAHLTLHLDDRYLPGDYRVFTLRVQTHELAGATILA